MDDLFQTLLSWQFILFCLGIAAITEVLRRGIEFFILDNPKMPGTRTSKLWREFLLPIAPVTNGVLMAVVAVKYPYPQEIHSFSARVFFGLVGGLLSGLIYRVVAGMIKAKNPQNISESEADQLTMEVSRSIDRE